MAIEAVVEAVHSASVEHVEIILVERRIDRQNERSSEGKPHRCIDKIVLQERNFGKGAGLHAGFHIATGELVILQDVDLEPYDPRENPILLSPILEDRADVVFGLLLSD